MMGINIVTKLLVISAVIIIEEVTLCTAAISDRRLCFDPQCSVPISSASTLMAYGSNDPGIMSFKSNVEVTVFSKSAGKRQDLWGVEIDGKRGYAPKNLLREKTIFKKKLIHEVPTEAIASSKPDDTSAKHEAEDKKVVPNEPTKDEDTSKKLNPEPVERTIMNSDETSLPSMPAADQVSPSYEIHDGTTIPLAQNDEPAEPSYATQISSGIEKNMEQQPILTIHPSIASTFTFDTDPIHEDQPLGEKNGEEATSELPNEPSASTGATDHVHSSRNSDAIAGDKTGDAVEQLDVSSNQQNAEETTQKSEKSENKAESKSSISTDGRDNNISNEVENKAPTQTLDSKKIPKSTVETHTEAPTTELPADNMEDKKIVTNEGNSIIASENNDNDVSNNTSAEMEDNSEGHATTTDHTDDTEDNDSDDDDESEEADDDDETENDTSVEERQSADQKSVESKPAEEVPATPQPQNIMGPLFSRLSAIPNVVKEIVAKTMSSGVSEENLTENTEDAIVTDSKAKDSRVDEAPISSEANSPAVDFSTDNNNVNESMNNNDNSKPTSDPTDRDITNSEAVDVREKFVNNNNNVEITSGNDTDHSKSIEDPSNNDMTSTESKNVEYQFVNNNNTVGIEIGNDTDYSKPIEDRSNNDTTNTESSNIENQFVNNNTVDNESSKDINNAKPFEVIDEKIVTGNNDGIGIESGNVSTSDSVETKTSEKLSVENSEQPGIYEEDDKSGFRSENFATDESSSFNGFPANRNLLNVGSDRQINDLDHDSRGMEATIAEKQTEPAANDVGDAEKSVKGFLDIFQNHKETEIGDASSESEVIVEAPSNDKATEAVESTTAYYSDTEEGTITETPDACRLDSSCEKPEGDEGNHSFFNRNIEEEQINEEIVNTESFATARNYWETLAYVVITAFTTLLFSLGYYYIENKRRDGELIAKINKLEKELLVSSKECMVLDDTLKSTKTKLDSIEDESFGSNEMVLSLKTDLEASQAAKSELEEQVTMLEKELETATEAGLELERMLREILSTNNQDNPLAQSVEDLQTRLNAQQSANEALTNALNLKAQENESLTVDLAAMTQKSEQLEVEVTRVTEELKHQINVKNNLEQNLLDKLAQLENQVKDIAAERLTLRKQLKGKEMELKDVLEVFNQTNTNNLDFEKLYNVSRVKAEASQLLEERNELQMRLNEVEGAHQLLEEHTKLINEEVSSLSEQCKLAEKAKRDAETRVEVLSNFFKEKEAQRQKEEAVWLQKQGEVTSTVERLHTMQNEIHNYKQQIEMLKREILDQEREYKNQIASLETKTHEHWVMARQNERRLEESKAEAGQLRNRLTLIEKNLNDTDPEAKLHRLETNGETATSPQLFIGAEASSSPIMFTGSSGVPFPPPSSYRYGPPPPFMPPPTYVPPGIPPYEVGQRPPPLGGRLSSPPPLSGSGPGRYDDHRSPPPPLSPSILPPFGGPHRGFPPPPFANDRIHPPPPPPSHSSMLPPPPPPLGQSGHSWTNDGPPRNSGFRGHHQHQREQQQRPRNHKGSLHSSGESLDKTV